MLIETRFLAVPARGLDMKKISYSPDVDVLMISFGDRPIAYDEGEIILHYSEDGQLVLIEILDFRKFMSDEAIKSLIAAWNNWLFNR